MPQKIQGADMNIVPKIVCEPKYDESTQLELFKKMVEKEQKLKFRDYWEFHEWSYKNYPEFWDCVWRFFGIVHSKPYIQVYDKRNGFTNMEWFKGAHLNFAENVLKYRDSKMAIISTDADDDTQYISYKDLYDEVRVYMKALKYEGIKKGDYIACYMSNKTEAVVAYLASSAIGSIFCCALPLLGTKGVLSCLKQIQPKILFTSGSFIYGDKLIKMEERLPEIIASLPNLQKVVFIPSKLGEQEENIFSLPQSVYVSTFLHKAREELRHDPKDIEFEQLPFDFPLCIIFTSGTTGAPKGLVHSHGSFFASLKNFGLHMNWTRKDTLFSQSPVGWITWNLFVSSLCLGITVVNYDGSVFQESPTRFWDLIDKFSITCSLVYSSTMDFMNTHNWIPTPNHSLKTLRQIFPTGSPTKPSSYDFLTEKVKPGMFCSSAYGCSEVFGFINGINSNMPVHRGELQNISLGMDIRILNEKGHPVIGERGVVVLANPYPALPIGILNDESKEKVTELYLAEYPGFWNIADDAWQNPITKGLVVYGRSDDAMTPKGARYNCADIYFALEGFPLLEDSVVVSQYNKEMDERVILFVMMLSGHALTDEVKERIKETIERHQTFEHVPDIIMEAPDIPYNLTGKKLNGLVKKLINKKPILNEESVINPTSLAFFRNVNLGEF